MSHFAINLPVSCSELKSIFISIVPLLFPATQKQFFFMSVLTPFYNPTECIHFDRHHSYGKDNRIRDRQHERDKKQNI